MGFIISYNSIQPTIEKSQGITSYERPRNRKALKRFLGLAKFDRSFIQNLSIIAIPLYELVGKDRKYEWKEQQEKAFNEIKKMWFENLELNILDMEKSFELEEDVSERGVGAVQRQEDMPIAYISRTLNKAEQNYGITDREKLAGLWAMEKLSFYIAGKQFDYFTDHKPIEDLRKKSEFGSARIARWFQRLEKFNFNVIYKKGLK